MLSGLNRARHVLLFILGLAVGPVHSSPPPQVFTLAERVQCRGVLADLDWSYRTWPAANRTAKPARSALITDYHLHAEVEDRLRMETALHQLYGIKLDAGALQLELNRLADQSRDPQRLSEMYVALGGTAVTVGECLVRPELAERELRRAFSHDARWHSGTRSAAESWLSAGAEPRTLQLSGGVERIVKYVLDAGVSSASSEFPHGTVQPLSQAEFSGLKADSMAAAELGYSLQTAHELRETATSFVHEQVVSIGADSVEFRIRTWNKLDFDRWWATQRNKWSLATPGPTPELVLPASSAGTAQVVADTWRVPEIPWGRAGHSAIWTGSEMIIWGAENPSVRDTGSRYRPDLDSWVRLPIAPYAGEAVWTGSEMLVWDSREASGGRYNPLDNSWSEITRTGAPSARSDASVVWSGTELIVWGGRSSGSPSLATGARYNPEFDQWLPISNQGAPLGRHSHTAVWTGTDMIVWGGATGNSSVLLATGGRYDPISDSWSSTSGILVPTPRIGHSAVWSGTHMLVWGGAAQANGGRYDPVQNIWSPISGGAQLPRSGHTAVWTGKEMIVWGGSLPQSFGSSSGGRYDPVTDVWMPTAVTGVPEARARHTAVWTGSEMLVWGGQGGGSAMGTGGRYDPISDRWIRIRDDKVIQSRQGYSAAWTGAELIIWGGVAEGSILGNGARYRPATDSWRYLTDVGAPAPRYGALGTWTGTEFLVWGGRVSFGDFGNDGGHYNPASDTWSPLQTVGAPLARDGRTVVWTGTEMIVWGGYEGGTLLNTGGRYNPDTRVWASTSTQGVMAKYGHSAVWANNEMIIWGGRDNLVFASNVGVRYRPDTDTWTPLQNAGAPEGRYSHSAIWTGNEMIVWGGSDSGELASGGRFRPDTNSWTYLSRVFPDIPLPRKSHSAFWTGTEMLVWGGTFDNQFALSSGERFNPGSNTWYATSQHRAPALSGHTAFWTGNAMLLWSDYSQGTPPTYYPYAFVVDEVFADGFE